ncbi:MAG: hypothetical protein U0M02_07335 [Acutalibacteraceae bacterium]|nr:hypothetical protein [Acutalibacteraceae bacterium]
MKKTVSTNIRFNLKNEADRKAWEYLQSMDRKKYKSYSKAVICALCEYFEREQKLSNDPYLETREKEDAFLNRILQTIETGLCKNSSSASLGSIIQLLQQPQTKTEQEKSESSVSDAALNFADSF